MSNSIIERMESGKVGELLVQISLLQFGVQAALPVIDSGNDYEYCLDSSLIYLIPKGIVE